MPVLVLVLVLVMVCRRLARARDPRSDVSAAHGLCESPLPLYPFGVRLRPVTLVVAAALAGPAYAAPIPLAILTLGDAPAAARLRSQLHEGLTHEPELQVIAAEVVDRQLRAAEVLGLRCRADDVTCWVKLGVSAGFARMLVSTAARSDDGGGALVVAFRVIDVAAETELSRDQAALSPDDDGAVVALATKVLFPERFRGRLVVTAAPADAALALDGIALGTLPLAKPTDVAPGPHRIVVTRDGHAPFEVVINVEAGGTTQIQAVLTPADSAGGGDSVGIAWGVAAAAAGVAALCGIGGGLVEWTFLSPPPSYEAATDKAPLEAAEIGLFSCSAVLGAVAVGGVVYAVVNEPE